MNLGHTAVACKVRRRLFLHLTVLLLTCLPAVAQTTSQDKESKRYPSGVGYFLFSNVDALTYCSELPRSIPRGNVDVEKAACLEANRKTARRKDVGEEPSIFELKSFWGLGFWISLLPATLALCCFTDKPGVAKLGGAAESLIELLSVAEGWQKRILTAALAAVMASPVMFAVAWAETFHSTMSVMIDNAQPDAARVEFGDVPAFTLPPMSRVFVYVGHPQHHTTIHVTSSSGYEESAVLQWNDETMPWIYDIGGANQDRIAYVTYLRR